MCILTAHFFSSVLWKQQGLVNRLDGSAPGPRMTQDLCAYFMLDGPLGVCTFSELHKLAANVYNQFFTTEAHLKALGLENRSLDDQQLLSLVSHYLTELDLKRSKAAAMGEDIVPMDLELDQGSQAGSSGSSDRSSVINEEELADLAPPLPQADIALANAILLMCDSFLYYELAVAISEGDPGRVLEVIKVSWLIQQEVYVYMTVSCSLLGSSFVELAHQTIAMNYSNRLVDSFTSIQSLWQKPSSKVCLSIHRATKVAGMKVTCYKSTVTRL